MYSWRRRGIDRDFVWGPRPKPDPRNHYSSYGLIALTKDTIIEVFDLIADETKQASIKSFLHLRQVAMQSEQQNEAACALV